MTKAFNPQTPICACRLGDSTISDIWPRHIGGMFRGPFRESEQRFTLNVSLPRGPWRQWQGGTGDTTTQAVCRYSMGAGGMVEKESLPPRPSVD